MEERRRRHGKGHGGWESSVMHDGRNRDHWNAGEREESDDTYSPREEFAADVRHEFLDEQEPEQEQENIPETERVYNEYVNNMNFIQRLIYRKPKTEAQIRRRNMINYIVYGAGIFILLLMLLINRL